MKLFRLALILVAMSACGDNASRATDGGTDAVPEGPFKARGSVEQVHVWKAPPATEVAVVDANGARIVAGTTDSHGSIIFRKVAPGTGYHVHSTALDKEVGPIDVLTVENSLPDQSFYAGQTLVAGNQYITTRDGTTLSAYVTLPGPPERGPYPTIVTYSGYAESRPGAPIVPPEKEGLCNLYPIVCVAPTNPSALFAGIFNYATVSVNMRGTGCSGGAYDYFEELQQLDGYDIIETVAAQPWVMNGKVGMVGLSYPGISQLFVASVRPPHLAAIAPMSVIGDSFSTMLPGGMMNEGFAGEWITNVLKGAKPFGQGWEQAQVDAGDAVCGENQLLHDQYVDNIAMARATTYYDPSVFDRYNPSKIVDKIDVPVFLASAFQDEQTGPYFFTLLDKFTASPATRLTVYNGVHIDAFQPAVLGEWIDFLELFVANRVGYDNHSQRVVAPMIFEQVFHTNDLDLPPSRFAGQTDVAAARAQWMAEPRVRVLFESGAGPGKPAGEPVPSFEHSFTSFPANGQAPARLYAHADGSLVNTAPTAAGDLSYALDPDNGTRGILAPGGNVWDLLPAYNWRESTACKAVVLETAPLSVAAVNFGTASADLWLRSSVDDADLQVTITEVRPDCEEMYVQAGTQRASLAKSSSAQTDLWPAPSETESDSAKLTPGEWKPIRVGVPIFAHVFRPGSKIRVTIDTPGATRAQWTFKLLPFAGGATYDIGSSAAHPSSIELPFVNGVTAPSTLPACPSLRGQPCRVYQAYTNTPAAN
ncbi:hypothetical protein BH11MYX2_BH11MYX2_08960 [soil metagenome]